MILFILDISMLVHGLFTAIVVLNHWNWGIVNFVSLADQGSCFLFI